MAAVGATQSVGQRSRTVGNVGDVAYGIVGVGNVLHQLART